MTAQQALRTAVIFAATFGAAYFIYLILDVLILFLISIIIALAIRKPVKAVENRKINRAVALLIVYGVLVVVIVLLAVVILPPAVRQFSAYLTDEQSLVKQIVTAESRIEALVEDNTDLEITLPDEAAIQTTVASTLRDLRARVPALAGNFGSLLSNFVLVFVIAGYLILSLDRTIASILELFPKQQHAEVLRIIDEIEQAVGGFVRGSLLVATIVGILDFGIMTLLRVPNAGMLALIVATTTTIPVIGGYIGAITATLLALLTSPTDALIALAVILVVQQIENYLLSPRIIESTVNLNPVITIVSLLIGFAVAGGIGALIAVPVASTVKILVHYLVIKPRIEQAAVESVLDAQAAG
jgi:predicted PurR-regulated permease PerM